MLTLATDCQLSSEEGRRQLRSADSRTCIVRRTYSNFGDRCFAAAGPRLWNSLPPGVRQTVIGYEQFKRLLKTYLFGCWGHGTLTICLNCACANFPTYLLSIFDIFNISNQTAITKVTTCGKCKFLQRVSIASYAKRCISHDRFCLTVWPSVTVRYHAKTTPATIMRSSLEDSPVTLVSSWLTSSRNSKGNIGSESTEWERGRKNRQF